MRYAKFCIVEFCIIRTENTGSTDFACIVARNMKVLEEIAKLFSTVNCYKTSGARKMNFSAAICLFANSRNDISSRHALPLWRNPCMYFPLSRSELRKLWHAGRILSCGSREYLFFPQTVHYLFPGLQNGPAKSVVKFLTISGH
jgi:hypothetical protein